MNYDMIFKDDANKEFYYNKHGYPTTILVNGFISLDNAKARLLKGEYYVLLEYQGHEELPAGYVPISKDLLLGMKFDEETQFAIADPKFRFSAISQNGSIQLISKLPSPQNDAIYLLGPGPDKVVLSDLISEQLQAYKNEKTGFKSK